MSDIAVQRKDQPQSSTIARRELDPFRLMRDMLRWDPFREMAATFSVGSRPIRPRWLAWSGSCR
jgi:hypothetical protein